MDLFNDDCFNIFPKLKDKSIDCVIVDLPYGQTSCKWDTCIDLEKMWIELKRICKKKCNYVFFCTTKFGYQIIKSNEKWFRYDLIWEKSKKVGFLSANKMQLRKHEMIYVFGETTTNQEWNLPKEKYTDLKDYSRYLLDNVKITDNKLKNLRFFKPDKKDFCLMRKNTYNELIQKYNIDKLENFKTFQQLKKIWNKQKTNPKKPSYPSQTYNPQKTNGKPYKTGKRNGGVYGGVIEGYENVDGKRHPDSILQYEEPNHQMIYVFGDKSGGKKTYNPQKTKGKPYKTTAKSHSYYRTKEGYHLATTDNKGDRHPDSIIKIRGGKYNDSPYGDFKNIKSNNDGTLHPSTILKYKNPSKSVHRTQKPTDLLEFLVKSYTNEGDTIIDFTMGSGSTGVACKNTNRKFIGIEKDKDIYNIAIKRLK